MSVSNGLTLRTTNGVQTFRFFVALPVYRGSSTTVEDRRENLSGVIGGVFKTATVMDTILSTVALPHDVDLYLFPSGVGPIYSPLMSGVATRPKRPWNRDRGGPSKPRHPGRAQ